MNDSIAALYLFIGTNLKNTLLDLGLYLQSINLD